MREPEVPDFDFDAHIAELILRRYFCISARLLIVFSSDNFVLPVVT